MEKTIEMIRARLINRQLWRADGGPGSGNWGHKGRPGKVGGSEEGDGSHDLFQPKKSVMNKQISAIADASQGKEEESVKKIANILDTLENGSEITLANGYGILVKERWGWRVKGEQNYWTATDAAWEFIYEDPTERAVISKSAMSKEELAADRLKEAKKSWRNNESHWKRSETPAPLTEKATVTIQKDDAALAGEGITVKGKDGKTYVSQGEGWWKEDGTSHWLESKDVRGASFTGDYYETNFGLNGLSTEQCSLLRDTVSKLPEGLKNRYERVARTVPIVASGGGTFWSPRKGEIHWDKGSASDAESALHEMSHALDDGAVDIVYDIDDYQYHVTAASQNLDHLVTFRDKDADFEAMAKIVGYKTTGDGWFESDEERDKAAHKFWDWRMKLCHDNGGEEPDGFGSVSDAISALTLDFSGGSLLGGGHSQEYWRIPYNGQFSSMRSKEYWANFCALKALGKKEGLALLKQVTPRMYDAAEKTYEEAIKHGEGSK